MKNKNSQIQTLKKVFQYLGKYRVFVVLSILLATISVALTLYVPKLTGDAIDYIIAPGQVDFYRIMMILVRIEVASLTIALVQWIMGVCNNKMTYQVVQDIRNDAFRKSEI